MLELLEQALVALDRENWSLVNQYLQQLPLGKPTKMSQRLEDSQLQQVLDLAIQVLVRSDFQERWDVSKVFPKLGERAIAPLVKILEDEDAELELRWHIARILGELSHPSAVTALVELLQTAEDEDLAQMAATALANLGSCAIDALTSLLINQDTRLLAVRSLAHIRRVETIPPLLSVVDDSQAVVRATAIEALSSFHDPRILPVFLKALKDSAAIVRKEAIIGLSLRTNLQEEFNRVNCIEPLLWDLNAEVCQQAAIALGRIGTHEAAEALFHVLRSSTTPLLLQITIVRALGWIETIDTLGYLQQALKRTSKGICQEIISVLGRQSSPQLRGKAAKILVEFLNSGRSVVQESGIKQALAMALGQLGEVSTLKALMTLLADADMGVRLHAIAALKHFPDAHPQLQQLASDQQLIPSLKEGIAIALAEWQVAAEVS